MKISFGMLGYFFFVTVDGPPDKIIPFTKFKFLILSNCLIVKISEKTPNLLFFVL